MFARIEKGKLIIEMVLQKPTPSHSGKTLLVASTRGSRRSSAKVDGKPVFVVSNAYIQAEEAVSPGKNTKDKDTRRKVPLKERKEK